MLNNHVDLVVLYHDNPRYEGNRIVGFEVQPRSISHDINLGNYDAYNPKQIHYNVVVQM